MNHSRSRRGVDLWFQVTCWILVLSAVAKVISAVYLKVSGEEVEAFLLQPWFLGGGACYEVAVVWMFRSSRISTIPKLIVGFWTATGFLAAHIFYFTLKLGGCPCLGILSRGGGELGRFLNGLILGLVLYMFFGAILYFSREVRKLNV